jgi:UDP-N-acetylglucosamine--N-acetylmuramyl-(pentapeptide) pyrophosphoryl-undecaprenol N-acetylglucosamine transferase
MAIDVLFVGGGTAGHVIPAIATAQALLASSPELRIAYAGLAGSIEERLVDAAGLDFRPVEAVALPRRLSPALLRVPLRLARAVKGARRLLKDEQVRVVVAFGGYVSMPLALAARGRAPLILHEQNSRPGLANRIAGRFASRVAVSFPASIDRFPYPDRCMFTGNPVQQRIHDLDRVGLRGPSRERLGLAVDRPTLLVFGGSQGARSINAAVVSAVAAWQQLGVQVLHLTGTRDYDDAVVRWQEAGVDPAAAGSDVRVVPFLADMSAAYASADVVLCRAGATTIAELTVLGIPSILVPYPHATADHQQSNADALVAVGAAVVIADQDLDAERLVDALRPLITEPARAGAMSYAARAWGRPHAASAVASLVVAALRSDGRGSEDA